MLVGAEALPAETIGNQLLWYAQDACVTGSSSVEIGWRALAAAFEAVGGRKGLWTLVGIRTLSYCGRVGDPRLQGGSMASEPTEAEQSIELKTRAASSGDAGDEVVSLIDHSGPPLHPPEGGGGGGGPEPPADVQDNFVEIREPVELMFCVILASAYAGLARYCWEPLEKSGSWSIFINIEGFFITITLLALFIGLRPYANPSSLQISKHGIKYRGPYWCKRRTVNWSQVVQMYVSPELILILYVLPNKRKSMRPLIIHSVYLADSEKIADSIFKYSPLEPTLLGKPGWITRAVQYASFAIFVFWIVRMLLM